MSDLQKKKVLKSNNWCSVPQCNYIRGNSLFHFPKDKKQIKKWASALKIGKTITSYMQVCASHFTKEDFFPNINGKRLRLKKNVIPSRSLPITPLNSLRVTQKNNLLLQRIVRSNRREINKFHMQTTDSSHSPNSEKSLRNGIVHSDPSDAGNSSEVNVQKTMEHEIEDKNYCKCENQESSGVVHEESEIHAANILLELSESEKCNLKQTDKNIINAVYDEINKENVTLMQLLKTDAHLKAFTGINFILLKNLESILLECEDRPNQYGCSVELKIVMCLCKIKLNLTFSCLAVLFNMKRQTCSHLFFITVHSLAYVLEDAIYWPSKEEILSSMPKCFQNFQDTYVVLDCTEIPVERPRCLKCHLRLYSHYKGCETIKFLVGVAPSGLLIYLSEPFGGRASDKAIFNYSNITDKLHPSRDDIMVDKGFAIEEECALARIKLYMPPKLGKSKQLTKTNNVSTVQVASARVHVERVIQRMKVFKILKSKISMEIAPHIGEIAKIIGGIVNLSAPVLSNVRF